MKHHFRAFLALILVVCLFAGIGGAVCAVDAADGSGTQYDPEFTLDDGGGYSEPVYRVIVEEGQKDQLKPDRSTATAGSTVTIKVADGVTADDNKVVDKNGKLVEIKKIDDNTYTFVMPASDVNVSGTVEDLRLNDTDHFAYITGYPDGTFKPNGNLTRAEAATIFYRRHHRLHRRHVQADQVRHPRGVLRDGLPLLLPERGQREVHRCPDHVLGL